MLKHVYLVCRITMESNAADKSVTLDPESAVNFESNLSTVKSETFVLNDECSQTAKTKESICDNPNDSRLNCPGNNTLEPSLHTHFVTREASSPVWSKEECGSCANSSTDVSSSYQMNASPTDSEHLLGNKFVHQDCGDTDSFIEIENCLKITSAVMECSRRAETSDFTEVSRKFDTDDAESTCSLTEMKNSPMPGAEVLSSVGLIHKKCSNEFSVSSTSYEGSSKLVSSVTDSSHSKEMLNFIVPADNVDTIRNSCVINVLEERCSGVSTDSACSRKILSFAEPDMVKSSPSESVDFHALKNEAINQECVAGKHELPSFSELTNANSYPEVNRVMEVNLHFGEDEKQKFVGNSNPEKFSEFIDSSGSTVCEERSDNSFASELISSENMNDFFDEMYDVDYRNRIVSSRATLKDFSENSMAEKNSESNTNSEKSQFVENRTETSDHFFEDLGFTKSCAPQQSADVTIKSSLKRTSNQELDEEYSSCKKLKKAIKFDSVSVYYFPRTQGFTCIPSQGGSTLGMSWNHSHSRKFSLGEHAAEQRRIHRQLCAQQLSLSRGYYERSNISSEDSDSDDIISDSEVDYENYNFLQPIPTRERRAMLRAAGIHKIDSIEKDECRSIRLSREFCGCTCQIYCDPEKCVCAQAGIKCQVDRMNFPCSCSREGCSNENGRIEFNPVRVRTHYVHTLMRLEMEKKKEEEERRNRLILNSLECSQLAYPASSNLAGNRMTNFSYQNNLLSFYSQPSGYEIASSSGIDNQCFNVNYSTPNNQYIIPTVSETISYHQSNLMSAGLDADNSTTTQYCSHLSVPSEELQLSHYDNFIKTNGNQNFINRNLTSDSEQNFGNDSFNSESFVPLEGKSCEQLVDTAGQGENLDTSAEISEETEKEESDSENFGDIIKKTMVESVSA